MKLLFVTWHFGCLRNFEQPLLELASRGHHIHLAATQEEAQGGLQLVERLAAQNPNITIGWTPSVASQSQQDTADRFRLGLDYLRYLDPTYEQATRLRTRAEERTPRGLLWLLRVPGLSGVSGRRRIASALRAIETALPRDLVIEKYLRDQAPDLVLFTPLIGLGSPEVEYLSAARRLGLRTVFCVWSWDNLSSKSLLRDMPDLVTVWNDTQRQEAVALHGVPPERIVATGAQCFDHWFNRQPSRSREVFCGERGLSAEHPFILYVCSALFRGSPSEAAFVRRWAQAIRRSPDVRLRTVPILVRPHPSRLSEWKDVTLDDIENTVLFGGNPVTPEARRDYFDSLYHSAVVVGLNTSAMLEAGIVGRPVMTILSPEFADNQEGTLHFHYLLGEKDGLVHQSRSLEEHVTQVADVLESPNRASARSSRFVGRFIRPFGAHVSGTERFVRAIDEALGASPQPAVSSSAAPAPAFARWMVRNADAWPLRSLLLSTREHDEITRRNAYIRSKRRAKMVRQVIDQISRARRWWERSLRRRARALEERHIKRQKRAEKSARMREKQRCHRRSRLERWQQLISQGLRHLLGARTH